MRRIILSVGLSVGLLFSSLPSLAQPAPAAPAAAGEPSARALALTERYLKATDMEKLMGDSMAAVDYSKMFPGELSKNEDLAAMIQSSREATAAITPRLVREMAPIMASIYTEEELEAMVVFYESPVGRSIMAKTPALTQATMELTYRLMPAIMTDMMDRYCRKRACSPEMKDAMGAMFGK